MWTKQCPNCAEDIKSEAKVCIHCWRNVNQPFWTPWMRKLVSVAVAMLLMILMFGQSLNSPQKSFWRDVIENK